MTHIPSEYINHKLKFGKLKGREVIANFDGGKIRSDAGIMWIAKLDKKLKITASFARCFQDYRHSSYQSYSVISSKTEVF